MADLDINFDMESAAPPFDLHRAPFDDIIMLMKAMPYKDRFTCALVCQAWAKAAGTATCSIVLKSRVKDLSSLQQWLEKHGRHLDVLQLHECDTAAALTSLPCPQLRNLLLCGIRMEENVPYILQQGRTRVILSINNQVWSDIAAATKLTSVSLRSVQTASQHADVVSALAALPDLKQLTLRDCRGVQQLSDSLLLQHLTKLTALDLDNASAEALQHLGSLTKLQHLSLAGATDWAAAGCPGLQELQALTRLHLYGVNDALPSIHQLTALQQLDLAEATLTALNGLQPLTRLTLLRVSVVNGLSLESARLQLPGLQHLELRGGTSAEMPMSFLSDCTQLQVLSVRGIDLMGPGSLVISTTLRHMVLKHCRIIRLLPPEDMPPVLWQRIFSGPGQLPGLTSLELSTTFPAPQDADMEQVVQYCSSLQRLKLDYLYDRIPPSAAVGLPGLTSLYLGILDDQQCRTLAHLTSLKELTVSCSGVSDDGIRALAALECLSSLIFDCGLPHAPVSIFVRQQLSDLSGRPAGIINKAPAGCPPDVSSRLKEACDLAAVHERCCGCGSLLLMLSSWTRRLLGQAVEQLARRGRSSGRRTRTPTDASTAGLFDA